LSTLKLVMHCHYYYCVLFSVVKLLPKSDYCYLYVDLHLPTYQTFTLSES
jgi:ribulose-5-phosphate 4-epimerase/fuculose-1-phosphate aldolase